MCGTWLAAAVTASIVNSTSIHGSSALVSLLDLEDTRMDLVAIAGTVSHVNRLVAAVGEAPTASYVTTLRIDGRHVEIADRCTWASVGDHVAIVGEEGPDGLIPLAVRNDTSGYEGLSEASHSYGFAILMIVLGIVLFALIIGIFLLAWGLFLLFKIRKDKKVIAEAQRRLDSLPRASAAPVA